MHACIERTAAGPRRGRGLAPPARVLKLQVSIALGEVAEVQASASSGALHNPFMTQAWWQQAVDQAPMAKGTSRRQWQKDMQAGQHVTHEHTGPWQWLGWMGRREGRRAWVQAGGETLSVQVGQAIAKEPVVVEAMDAQGLRLRRWGLNAQGRWEAKREFLDWIAAE